jgi:hypothetical protein
MVVSDWIKVFERLLPKSRIWRLIVDRPLRRIFYGLGGVFDTIYQHAVGVLDEAFPLTTTHIGDWTFQFGSPEPLDSDGLAAEWAAVGGQTPAYFQNILHTAGFVTCFVHEWPVPGSNPVEARNPIALVPTSRVLVNDINHIERRYRWQCGDNVSQCVSDHSIRCGDYDGYHLVPKAYPTPDIESQYPYYFYVCGQVWPSYAIIPYSQLRKLIRLCYKMKPMHLRIILRVSAYDDGPVEGDYDIQDTWWHDEKYQDQISDPSPEETIHDYY